MNFINEKHGKIEVIDLTDTPQYLSLFAQWTENEWGYVRNKGVEFRTNLFKQYIATPGIPNMYGLFLNEVPIGMFAIEQCEPAENCLFLNYLYLLPDYRNSGIGSSTVNVAKRICKSHSAHFMQLTTLDIALNKYYENLGGRVLGEEYFYTYPATRMELTL